MRYWIYRDSQILGPLAKEEFALAGGLRPETLVCTEDASGRMDMDWRSADSMPELSDLCANAAGRGADSVLTESGYGVMERLQLDTLAFPGEVSGSSWVSALFSPGSRIPAHSLPHEQADVHSELAEVRNQIKALADRFSSPPASATPPKPAAESDSGLRMLRDQMKELTEQLKVRMTEPAKSKPAAAPRSESEALQDLAKGLVEQIKTQLGGGIKPRTEESPQSEAHAMRESFRELADQIRAQISAGAQTRADDNVRYELQVIREVVRELGAQIRRRPEERPAAPYRGEAAAGPEFSLLREQIRDQAETIRLLNMRLTDFEVRSRTAPAAESYVPPTFMPRHLSTAEDVGLESMPRPAQRRLAPAKPLPATVVEPSPVEAEPARAPGGEAAGHADPPAVAPEATPAESAPPPLPDIMLRPAPEAPSALAAPETTPASDPISPDVPPASPIAQAAAPSPIIAEPLTSPAAAPADERPLPPAPPVEASAAAPEAPAAPAVEEAPPDRMDGGEPAFGRRQRRHINLGQAESFPAVQAPAQAEEQPEPEAPAPVESPAPAATVDPFKAPSPYGPITTSVLDISRNTPTPAASIEIPTFGAAAFAPEAPQPAAAQPGLGTDTGGPGTSSWAFHQPPTGVSAMPSLPASVPAPVAQAQPAAAGPQLLESLLPMTMNYSAGVVPDASALAPAPVSGLPPFAAGSGAAPANTQDVLAKLAKPQPELTQAPKSKPKRGQMMFMVIGVLLGVMVLAGWFFLRDSGDVVNMVGADSAQAPAEHDGQGEALQAPKMAAPASVTQVMPSEAAPAEQPPAGAAPSIRDERPAAIELVKAYPLDGDRGSIGQWLQYSFAADPGQANSEKWDAGAIEESTYLVQYTVQPPAKNMRAAITYLFEADVARRTVRGKNPAAKDLLSGGGRSRSKAKIGKVRVKVKAKARGAFKRKAVRKRAAGTRNNMESVDRLLSGSDS